MQSKVGTSIAIIGGGPSGLMAADILSQSGYPVDLFERMPTLGRKFLMAGRSGLNLTHAEPFEQFLTRFQHTDGVRHPALMAALSDFDNQAIRHWADDLGAQTFVGSSGRVFPRVMKAAPLLRAWLKKLEMQGVKAHLRHHLQSWRTSTQGATLELIFSTPEGSSQFSADRVLLALGGASWPRLGSDGEWVKSLSHQGIAIAPLKPANCGFNVAWSPYLVERFAGTPLKQVGLYCQNPLSVPTTPTKRGDIVLTRHGFEGSALYAISAELREALDPERGTTLFVDLLPDRGLAWLIERLDKPKGKQSWTQYLKRTLNLSPLALALIREISPDAPFSPPSDLARLIKSLPITLSSTRPLSEAISTAGGVAFSGLGMDFQLLNQPGVFCAGEMLDWEAPTGGYLLSACLATGRAAAQGLLRSLPSSNTNLTEGGTHGR